TVTAAQIAVSRGLPFLSIADFDGAAKQIWRTVKGENLDYIKETDIQAMANWANGGAQKCIESLNNQFNRISDKQSMAKNEAAALVEKARNWDNYVAAQKDEKSKNTLAIIFLIIFAGLFLAGIISRPPLGIYTVITFLGL